MLEGYDRPQRGKLSCWLRERKYDIAFLQEMLTALMILKVSGGHIDKVS